MKKAKIILFAVLIMVVACFSGCNSTKKNGTPTREMTIIDRTDDYMIYKHDTTGVYYFCVIGSHNKAVCVMLNADGTPYTGE